MNALTDSCYLQHSSQLLSLVIPVYNEAQMLPILLSTLKPILNQLDMRFEIVLVDDGSTDHSAQLLKQASNQDHHIKSILLSRNYGKEAALTAGLAHCSGDAIIIMDADLQDPPELIPQMIAAWRSGADVVTMRRRSRQGENWFKRATAKLYYQLLKRLSQVDIPTDTGDFRLLNRQALNAVLSLKERNRYMKGIFAWVGYQTTVIDYDRAPRAAGTTKWSPIKLAALAFEGLSSFSTAPLRLTVLLGLIIAVIGMGFGLWIILKTLFIGEVVQGYPSLIAIVTVLGGFQLCAVGLVGEYVGKVYLETKARPLYLIKEIVEQPTTTSIFYSLTASNHA